MITEYIGFMGFSWQERIAKAIYDSTTNSSIKKALRKEPPKAGLIAPVQASAYLFFSGWNTNIINTMHGWYLINGSTSITPEELSEISEVNQEICKLFLLALKSLSTKGIIKYDLYDPWVSKTMTDTSKKLLSPTNLNSFKNYFTIAALLVGGVIVTNLLTTIKTTTPKG